MSDSDVLFDVDSSVLEGTETVGTEEVGTCVKVEDSDDSV
jgi:hypothetical protein